MLFDPQTMNPRITEATFVKALQRLATTGSKRIANGTAFAQSMPVFGSGDPMVAVSADTRNGASASKLVARLTSADVGTQLAQAAGALPARRPGPIRATAFGHDPDRREPMK